jgi:hypothetical protein
VDHREAQIRREIEDTRAAMSAKAAIIQERVDETIEGTASTVVESINTVLEHVQQVQNTIAYVTSTVDMTVARVQETAHQTIADGRPAIELIADLYKRPWVMLGAAMVVGYILGAGGRSVSAISPATPQSTCGANLDSYPAENPTGNPFNSPSRSSAEGQSPSLSGHLSRPDNPS